MKHKRILAVLLSMLVLSLVACTNEVKITEKETQTVISFSWWGNDERNEYTLEAIRQFEELHPEIKVDCYYTEWSGYQTKNDIRMASNTESDVMQINFAWITQYSPDGTGYYDISELTEYVDLSSFTEKELNYGMQNGKLNALPIALNTETYYYNKTLFEENGLTYPKTWEDLFDVATKLPEGLYVAGMPAKSAFIMSAAYTEQKTGRTLVDAEGNLKFTAEDLEEMISFYCSLVREGVIPATENFSKSSITDGDYAGFVAWISDAGSYSDLAIKGGYEVEIGDYLTFDGKPLSGWYAKPATMYAIGKNTDHPKEAAILLDFLLNSEEMALLQGLEKGIPLSEKAKAVLESNDMLYGIQYDAYEKMIEHADSIQVMSAYYENQDLIDAFYDACNEVYYEVTPLEDAALALKDSMELTLEQTRGE